MITSPNEESWILPHHGALDPASEPTGTTPGSLANRPDIGGPLSFSSPDTPGMPSVSGRTAWDFLPDGWTIEAASDIETGCAGHNQSAVGTWIRAVPRVCRFGDDTNSHPDPTFTRASPGLRL